MYSDLNNTSNKISQKFLAILGYHANVVFRFLFHIYIGLSGKFVPMLKEN